MVETLTPAVCGGRQRHHLATALFALGALSASAVLGALLGLAGRGVERTPALAALAALALVVAGREAGLIPLPVPQLRRQVPERWRRSLPLPLWSAGYGAGLGLGLATHQPVATLWAAAGGALALGRPAAGAACLAFFGAGRALMTLLPRAGQPAERVARLAAGRRLLRPANAAALVVLAALAGASAARAEPVPRGRIDPAVSGAALAYVEIDGDRTSVVVRSPGSAPVRFPGGRSPAVDGPLLAYVDAEGIRVVRWRTGAEVARVAGPVDKPALEWPLLAYVRRDPGARRLVLTSLVSRRARVLAQARASDDLGRPALRGGRIAWHVTRPRDSRLLLRRADLRDRPRVIASSRTAVVVNPALTRAHLLWVEQRGEVSRLRLLRLGVRGEARTIARLSGRNRLYWTTALSARRAYVTAWSLSTGRARLVVRNVRPGG
jgi:hypothetical protein